MQQSAGGVKVGDASRLNKVARRVREVIGNSVDYLELIVQNNMLGGCCLSWTMLLTLPLLSNQSSEHLQLQTNQLVKEDRRSFSHQTLTDSTSVYDCRHTNTPPYNLHKHNHTKNTLILCTLSAYLKLSTIYCSVFIICINSLSLYYVGTLFHLTLSASTLLVDLHIRLVFGVNIMFYVCNGLL